VVRSISEQAWPAWCTPGRNHELHQSAAQYKKQTMLSVPEIGTEKVTQTAPLQHGLHCNLQTLFFKDGRELSRPSGAHRGGAVKGLRISPGPQALPREMETKQTLPALRRSQEWACGGFFFRPCHFRVVLGPLWSLYVLLDSPGSAQTPM
jgi:hypothetical protein